MSMEKKSRKNKKVTLSIDSSIYDSFQRYCEENAIMLSKRVEIWMAEEMKDKMDDAEKK